MHQEVLEAKNKLLELLVIASGIQDHDKEESIIIMKQVEKATEELNRAVDKHKEVKE